MRKKERQSEEDEKSFHRFFSLLNEKYFNCFQQSGNFKVNVQFENGYLLNLWINDYRLFRYGENYRHVKNEKEIQCDEIYQQL